MISLIRSIVLIVSKPIARSNGRIVKVVVYGRLPRTVVHGAGNVCKPLCMSSRRRPGTETVPNIYKVWRYGSEKVGPRFLTAFSLLDVYTDVVDSMRLCLVQVGVWVWMGSCRWWGAPWMMK